MIKFANATVSWGKWFLPLGVAGCDGPLSTLEPAGPAASTIATFWWVMLVGAALLALLVFGLLAFVYLNPGAGRRVSPKSWIAYGGLAMPVVILTVLTGYALYAGERLLARPDPDVPRVAARGEMWAWRFSYPDNPEAPNTDVLHIPAGQPVDVLVTAEDVIHSFWVPRLAGKIDAIPGHENVVRIEADRPGTYQGVCAEYCGTGHTSMRFVVIAHEPEEFATLMGAGL